MGPSPGAATVATMSADVDPPSRGTAPAPEVTRQIGHEVDVEPSRSGPTPRVHTVMIVEDHDVMRETLVDLIDRLSGFRVSASVASGEAALRAPERRAVDIVLVDMSLPGMTGAQYVAEMRRRRPDVSCVMLSGHREPQHVDRAFAAGAMAYVVKGRPVEIEQALRTVAAGHQYRSPSLP